MPVSATSPPSTVALSRISGKPKQAAALPRVFQFFEHDGEHFARQAVVERRS